jgi:hypothetical protein
MILMTPRNVLAPFALLMAIRGQYEAGMHAVLNVAK